MKKIFTLLLAFVTTTALWAHDFEVNGIYYSIRADKTNEVYVSQGDNRYSGSVTIPATVTYNGTTYSVTSIGGDAFAYCSGLTSITIPNSVTTIDGSAFRDCSGLTSITIPNSVISIRHWAFYECSGLTSVTIGNSVTSIGDKAFASCSSLTSVTIPNSVTSIGGDAFYKCSSLTSVVWNAENCADSYDSPFSNPRSQITSFTFGDSVKHIPAYLCNGMSKLTSITIPNSVTSIGDYAFSYSSGLTSITIPNSVTSIGDYAFRDCSSLTSITIPNSVTSIGRVVFYACSSLTSVTAPAVFFDFEEESWIYQTKSLTYTKVNAGELTANAFGFINRSYKTLKVLNLAAATNTTIADEAFKGCYNLDSLYLPAQLEYIPYMAVAECKLLRTITIPATVEEIDNSAFENCRSLKSVIFEGAAVPKGADSYASASGSSLWRIGSWAFYNCHQLQQLTIPEGVTELGDAAFYGCTYLEEMSLPSTIQSIGDNGFALCAKLEIMYVKAPVPPTIQAKTFLDVNRKIPVYVPDGAVDAYKDDPYWSEFKILSEENAVENVINPTSSAQKILCDGHLIIIRDGVEYNAMGMEL